jgi:hypothetical protein
MTRSEKIVRTASKNAGLDSLSADDAAEASNNAGLGYLAEAAAPASNVKSTSHLDDPPEASNVKPASDLDEAS